MRKVSISENNFKKRICENDIDNQEPYEFLIDKGHLSEFENNVFIFSK